MAVKTASVTVAATATLLSGTDSDNIAGYSIAVQVPSGGASVFVGGSDVTSSGATKGWEVTPTTPFSMDLRSPKPNDGVPTEALYGITASGTQAVTVIRSGV